MGELYRFNRDKVGDGYTWMIPSLVRMGILIPVEPDDEAAVRLYADWQGVDWADGDGMESCRIQVGRLMGAAGLGGDSE